MLYNIYVLYKHTHTYTGTHTHTHTHLHIRDVYKSETTAHAIPVN